MYEGRVKESSSTSTSFIVKFALAEHCAHSMIVSRTGVGVNLHGDPVEVARQMVLDLCLLFLKGSIFSFVAPPANNVSLEVSDCNDALVSKTVCSGDGVALMSRVHLMPSPALYCWVSSCSPVLDCGISPPTTMIFRFISSEVCSISSGRFIVFWMVGTVPS